MRLIDFGEVHSVGVLKTGDLPGMELDFQIGGQNGDVHRFTLCGAGAVDARAVQFHIAVMGEDKLVNDGVHG